MNLRRVGCLSACAFVLTCVIGYAAPVSSVTVSSPAFAQGAPIPAKHALATGNVSPELRIKDVPATARSLVLIVDDPDAPAGLWTHWLVWNLPPGTTSITEGKLPPEARQGKNSNGHVRYDGPSPPSGTHRYFFRIYALDTTLSLPPGANRAALQKAMGSEHVVGTGEIFGTYRAAP